MTDAELQAIRRRVEMAQAKPHTAYGRGIVYADDAQTLLAYVDFLRALLHDLQQDSAAYQRGVEAERERCATLLEREAAEYEDGMANGTHPDATLLRNCAHAVRNERQRVYCRCCGGLDYIPTGEPCPVCYPRQEQHT